MYFIILLLLLIMIIFSQKQIIEYFENKSKNIFLIGDSILQNKLYANPSIEDYLYDEVEKDKIFFFAEDNTTISSCSSQITQMNINYNNENSIVFISVGGNDILNKIVYTDNPTIEILNNIITDYTFFIKSLFLRMNSLKKSNIILLNIYYPTNSYFHKFYSYIDQWNKFINDFAEKNNYKVLDLTKFMIDKDDFSFSIEPSTIGGKKISNHIISYLK